MTPADRGGSSTPRTWTAWDGLAQRSDALLQGRRTYQVSAGPCSVQSGAPFADWINSVQKYVVSDRFSDDGITWQPTTIIRGAES